MRNCKTSTEKFYKVWHDGFKQHNDPYSNKYVTDLSWKINDKGEVELLAITDKGKELYFKDKELAEKVCSLANKQNQGYLFEVKELELEVFKGE